MYSKALAYHGKITEKICKFYSIGSWKIFWNFKTVICDE